MGVNQIFYIFYILKRIWATSPLKEKKMTKRASYVFIFIVRPTHARAHAPVRSFVTSCRKQNFVDGHVTF